MPYRDPALQREAVKRWKEENPEKIETYRRKSYLRDSVKKGRIPTSGAIARHNLTATEVGALVRNYMHICQDYKPD